MSRVPAKLRQIVLQRLVLRHLAEVGDVVGWGLQDKVVTDLLRQHLGDNFLEARSSEACSWIVRD